MRDISNKKGENIIRLIEAVYLSEKVWARKDSWVKFRDYLPGEED